EARWAGSRRRAVVAAPRRPGEAAGLASRRCCLRRLRGPARSPLPHVALVSPGPRQLRPEGLADRHPPRPRGDARADLPGWRQGDALRLDAVLGDLPFPAAVRALRTRLPGLGLTDRPPSAPGPSAPLRGGSLLLPRARQPGLLRGRRPRLGPLPPAPGCPARRP